MVAERIHHEEEERLKKQMTEEGAKREAERLHRVHHILLEEYYICWLFVHR